MLSGRFYAPDTGRVDRVMFWTTLLLLSVGMLAVYSSSSVLGALKFGGSLTFLEKQLIRAALGLGLMFVFSRFDYRRWSRWALPLWCGSLLMLVVLVVLKKLSGSAGMADNDLLHAHEVRGSWRRVEFGFMSLQPTEVAKVFAMMTLASMLARREGAPRTLRTFLGPLAVIGITSALIIAQPNFSSASALLALGFVMLLIAGIPWKWMLALAAAVPPAVYYELTHHGHHMTRLNNYFAMLRGDSVDVQSQVWQLWQSLVALGSGGLFGRGLGQSMQKFLFLPDPHTDFIFSIWGEELGFLGAVGLLLLLTLLAWRGFRASLRSPDPLGFYLAAALTLQIAEYAMVNVAVTTGLFPTTGLPLPFISFGGSSLVMNLFTVGILLNISRRAQAA